MAWSRERRSLRDNARLRRLAIQNVRFARRNWGISTEQIALLRAMTEELHVSVATGDLRLLDGKWYVTHGGLLRLARRHHCSGIRVQLVGQLSDPASNRWIFKATVYKTPRSPGFVGYGDASPGNTSTLVRGAEMRVAETRAVDRALRKAYGVAVCSAEELGSLSGLPPSFSRSAHPNGFHAARSPGNGQPRLRDQLCLLIRQHNLDPVLVKAFAADFCGTETLKEASRDLVDSFISHLATAAKEDRDALVCKLNSYAQPVEAKP